jgi:hypothetical protein
MGRLMSLLVPRLAERRAAIIEADRTLDLAVDRLERVNGAVFKAVIRIQLELEERNERDRR